MKKSNRKWGNIKKQCRSLVSDEELKLNIVLMGHKNSGSTGTWNSNLIFFVLFFFTGGGGGDVNRQE